MNQRIIFKLENGGIGIIIPAPNCGLTIEKIAAKDVPQGAPYLILDASEIPEDREFRGAWEADFSQPHGVGGEMPFQKQEVVEAEFSQVEE
jgi:hypothetical protein